MRRQQPVTYVTPVWCNDARAGNVSRSTRDGSPSESTPAAPQYSARSWGSGGSRPVRWCNRRGFGQHIELRNLLYCSRWRLMRRRTQASSIFTCWRRRGRRSCAASSRSDTPPSHGPSPQNISASTASGQATRFLAAAAAASAAAASEAASAAAAAEAMTTETAAPPVQLTALSRRVSWRSSFRESTSTLHPHSQSGTRRHTPRRCCDSTACE